MKYKISFYLIILIICSEDIFSHNIDSNASKGFIVNFIGDLNLQKAVGNIEKPPLYGVIGAEAIDKSTRFKLVFNIATNIDTITGTSIKSFGNALLLNGTGIPSFAPMYFEFEYLQKSAAGPFENFIGGMGIFSYLEYRDAIWRFDNITTSLGHFNSKILFTFPIIEKFSKDISFIILFSIGYTSRVVIGEITESKEYLIKFLGNTKCFYNGLDFGIQLKFNDIVLRFSIPWFERPNGNNIQGLTNTKATLGITMGSSIYKVE